MKKVFTIFFVLLFATSFAQVKVGDVAPEIKMTSPDGTILKLSDLRGKMVLIDFWASWCGPCRRENPNVVSAYNHFKDFDFNGGKSFTVFSVSLDKNATQWVEAIKQDGLVWPYHVSDLMFWQNAAAKEYGVRGIPASYLIDGNGVVVAVNLRGARLDAKLNELKK